MNKTIITIFSLAIILLGLNARWSRIEKRYQKIKSNSQVEQQAITQQAEEEIDPQMSINPYAVYDQMLANKANLTLLEVEGTIFNLDNMLNYAKTDASFLDEKTKNGLVEKRAEFVKLAQEKGSTKY